MSARDVMHRAERDAVAAALASGAEVTAECGERIVPLPADEARRLPNKCDTCERRARASQMQRLTITVERGWSA